MTFVVLRELVLACMCHGLVKVALRTGRLRTCLALPTVRLPRAARPLGLECLVVVARRSSRLCRGSCLTEAIVLKWLAARHGLAVPLTIGVRRSAGGLRAHAWNGQEPPASFTPVWTDGMSRRT